jgi:hypothetical protein
MALVQNPKELLFQAATTYMDTSPLPASDVAAVALKLGKVSGQYTRTVLDTSLAPGTDGLVHVNPAILGIADNEIWFVAAFTDTTVAAGAQESGPSNEISIQFVPKVPSPPTGFSAA